MKNYRVYSQITNNIQNSILNGVINRDKNIFDIKDIFEYNKKEDLESELKIISHNSIQGYINSRTYLSDHNKKDYISPIFSVKKIIVIMKTLIIQII